MHESYKTHVKFHKIFYKNLSKDITNMYNYATVENFHDALRKALEIENDKQCTYKN